MYWGLIKFVSDNSERVGPGPFLFGRYPVQICISVLLFFSFSDECRDLCACRPNFWLPFDSHRSESLSSRPRHRKLQDSLCSSFLVWIHVEWLQENQSFFTLKSIVMSIIHDGRYAFVFCNILRFINVVLKKQTFWVRSYCTVTVGCTLERVGRLFLSEKVLCSYAIVQERPQ